MILPADFEVKWKGSTIRPIREYFAAEVIAEELTERVGKCFEQGFDNPFSDEAEAYWILTYEADRWNYY